MVRHEAPWSRHTPVAPATRWATALALTMTVALGACSGTDGDGSPGDADTTSVAATATVAPATTVASSTTVVTTTAPPSTVAPTTTVAPATLDAQIRADFDATWRAYNECGYRA